MKFIHYISDKERIGVIKNNKIYRTDYTNIEQLFDLNLRDIVLGDIEFLKIKELPIIKYPKQDILCIGMNYKEHKEELRKLKR